MAVAAFVAAAVVVRLNVRPPARPAPSREAPIDTAAAYQALLEGTRLSGTGRNAASLPLLRTAVRGLPETWEARFNLASSLENAALESGTRLGRVDPVIRSSVERVRLVAEAGREREIALGIAGDARRRAWTEFIGAKVRLTWGMPVDALEMARRAQAFDPEWSAPAQLAASIEADLAGGGGGR